MVLNKSFSDSYDGNCGFVVAVVLVVVIVFDDVGRVEAWMDGSSLSFVFKFGSLVAVVTTTT